MIHLPNVAILFFLSRLKTARVAFVWREDRQPSCPSLTRATPALRVSFGRGLLPPLADAQPWMMMMKKKTFLPSLSPPSNPFPSSLSHSFFFVPASATITCFSITKCTRSAPGATRGERFSDKGGSTSSTSRNDSRRGWQRTDAARHKPVPRGHPPRILLSPPVVDASACWRVLCCRHRRLSKYSNTGGVGGKGDKTQTLCRSSRLLSSSGRGVVCHPLAPGRAVGPCDNDPAGYFSVLFIFQDRMCR